MLTITGFTRRHSSTSCQISSAASADPPGLFTRSTIARIEWRRRASRSASTRVWEPSMRSPNQPSRLRPDTISPSATTSAMRFEPPLSGMRSR